MSQEIYYRPPSEADSFIVRVMEGCPHNKCAFCNMFKDLKCRVLPLDEIARSMEQDAAGLGSDNLRLVESIYLEGGDPLAISTDGLLAIMGHAKSLFPALARFACYATARYTARKTQAELDALARAGLKTVFMGLESGSEAILQKVNKGCGVSDILYSALKLLKAGIDLDVSMMLGIGGRENSTEHARATARIINIIEPQCVRVRTFIPKTGTALGRAYLAGNFNLPGPYEIMRELRQMVSEINANTRLLSEHWSNFVLFNAYLPGAKEALLEHIDKHLAMPEGSFRKIGLDAARS